VELRSEPPGAEVYIEGERVGTTPLTWEETTSHAGDVTVSVRRGETEARFALARRGFAPEPILVGLALGVGSLGLGVAGMVIGYVLIGGGVVTALALPLSVPLLLTGLGVVTVSGALVGAAWLPPL